jgi:hypothetical protein
MEGKDGVPLRFPRPVMALIATGTAAISIGLSAVPASADQVRHQEWWLSSLRVTSAWAASQGAGVTVAVLSDGVDGGHADLAGAVTTAPAVPGAPVALGQYAGEQGTPIASLIAGRGHGPGGGAGIVGVAPEARILSVPVTLPPDDPQLAQSSVAAAVPGAIAAGIRYAVSHGATVIDLPIDPGQAASDGIGGASTAAGGSAAEQAAVSYALSHNVVLVAPAGDDEAAGDMPNYPAAYHGVIAVGAFDSAFNKAPYSSHQSYVTLTAAGAGVLAAGNAGGYVTMNSTSAASAVVAGVVALIRSRYPGLTVAEVRKALITTTTYRQSGGLAIGSGYGAVDAGQAMTAAAAMAAPPSDRASAGAQPLRLPATVSAPSATQGISAQVLRAGEISGGLLLLLLLLIGVYAATGRRRRRGQPAVAAEWTHRQAQSRYPQAGGADADRMLEVFAAPAAAAAPAPSPGRHATQPASAGSWARGEDEGLFAPATGRQPASAYPGQGGPGGALAARGALPSAGAGDIGGLQSHGPASRAVSRRAPVSGAPPWEPASAPDGELPWIAAPGGHAGPVRHDAAPPVAAMPTPSSAPAAFGAEEQAWPAAEQTWPAAEHAWPTRDNPYGPADWDAPAAYSASSVQPRREPVGPGQPGSETPARQARSDWGRAAHAGQSGWETPSRTSQPRTDAPARAGQPGWDRAARAGRLDREIAADGFGPPAAAGSSGGFSSPTGRNAAGDFGYPGASADQADWDAEPDGPPRVGPSGLPVRQPRATRSATPAPLSPSGSLWEPVSSEAIREPATYPGETQDGAGGPIFVWNPATPESAPTRHRD